MPDSTTLCEERKDIQNPIHIAFVLGNTAAILHQAIKKNPVIKADYYYNNNVLSLGYTSETVTLNVAK